MKDNPSRRAAFVEAEITSGLAHQVRAMRLQRGWSQRELARRLDTSQAAIARIEDSSYGKVSLQTIFKLAGVFDVAADVRFRSFVSFFKESWAPKTHSLYIRAFAEESEEVRFVESADVVLHLENRSSNMPFLQINGIPSALMFEIPTVTSPTVLTQTYLGEPRNAKPEARAETDRL